MKTKLIYKKDPHENIKEFTDEFSLVQLIKKSDHVFATLKKSLFCYELTYNNKMFIIRWKPIFENQRLEQALSFKTLISDYDIFALTEEDLFNFLTGE